MRLEKYASCETDALSKYVSGISEISVNNLT